MISSILHQLKRALIYFVAAFGYRRPIFNLARKAARISGKPLLNAGCGYVYTELSDVNLDMVSRKVPNFVRGDIQDLSMFQSKQFGAVYASHVLEHVEDPVAAMHELHRVAETVFIITPFPLSPTTWFWPGHKWVLWRGKRIARIPHFVRGIGHRAGQLLKLSKPGLACSNGTQKVLELDSENKNQLR